MSGKTIVLQPRTTETALRKGLLTMLIAVLAVSAAIAFASMASNDPAATANTVERRVDYGIRHPDEPFLVPVAPLEQSPDYLTRYLARSVPGSEWAGSHRSPDFGVRHLADWKQLDFLRSEN